MAKAVNKQKGSGRSGEDAYIWLQEDEAERHVDCGCSLVFVGNDPAFFFCSKHESAVVMYKALRGALAALSQNKTFPADVALAKSMIVDAIAKADGRSH